VRKEIETGSNRAAKGLVMHQIENEKAKNVLSAVRKHQKKENIKGTISANELSSRRMRGKLIRCRRERNA
jgi:hypothetical protein